MPRWTQEDYDNWKRKQDARGGAKPLPSVHQEPAGRSALVIPEEGADTRWYGTAKRFEITFIIYAQRPADFDGWTIKHCIDMCVAAGIIPEDDWRTLEGRIISRKANGKDEEKTVIEIRTLL